MKPNVILILIDSLSRHQMRPYQASAAEMPNLERFAKRARRFDNHFVGSLPCMPARREIFTGSKEMMWRPWGPLEPFDRRLPQLLSEQGYATSIVTDHYHYWEEQANGYVQSFETAELIRGHENDFWRHPVPEGESVPRWVERIERYRPGKGRSYYGNVKEFQGEEDYFPAKVMTAAAEWLQRYEDDRPFYLQVESFDVHEPFDVPEPYSSMFADGADKNAYNVWPPYQDTTELARFLAETDEKELDFIRSQYLGKLAMVDRWLGKLLDTLDDERLWDDTVVILTTDHGHDLGERGTFGKQWPHFDSHANIPLFIWDPEHRDESGPVNGLTSTVDLHATILDLADAELPDDDCHSRTILPLLAGNSGGRDAVVYGTFGQGVGVTDGTWTLLKSPQAAGPLFSYSSSIFPSLTADSVRRPVDQGYFIEGVELPQWKIPIDVKPLSDENHLYNRVDDPGMTRNLWNEAPGERERMLSVLRKLLESEGAPPEQFRRLGLERK